MLSFSWVSRSWFHLTGNGSHPGCVTLCHRVAIRIQQRRLPHTSAGIGVSGYSRSAQVRDLRGREFFEPAYAVPCRSREAPFA
jgi:hypothetical protein